MKQWNLRMTNQCPCCQQPAEGKDHLTQCQAMGAKEQWETLLQTLEDWMQTQQTEPGIRQEIIDGLRQWNAAMTTQTTTDQSEAAHEQEAVGWDLALEGCVLCQWRQQQECYWKEYKSGKSSKRWTMELIKKLMGIAWDMWQHQNKALHEEPDNRALILETGVNEQVTELYNLGAGAFLPSAALMKHTLPDLLQLPQAYKIHWIGSAKIAKDRKDKQRAGPYASERRYMQTWLIWTQHNLR